MFQAYVWAKEDSTKSPAFDNPCPTCKATTTILGLDPKANGSFPVWCKNGHESATHRIVDGFVWPKHGKIIGMGEDGKTLVINKGTREGLRPGCTLEINRSGKIIGTARVDSVDGTMSVAFVMKTYKDRPKELDDVKIEPNITLVAP